MTTHFPFCIVNIPDSSCLDLNAVTSCALILRLARDNELFLLFLIYKFPLTNVLALFRRDPNVGVVLLLPRNVLVRAAWIQARGEFAHDSAVPKRTGLDRAIGTVSAG